MGRGRPEKLTEDLKLLVADLKRNSPKLTALEIQGEIKTYLIKKCPELSAKEIEAENLPGESAISKYLTEHKESISELSPLDKLWHIGMLKESPLPTEVITRILKLQKTKYHLTVRDVQWINRFHQAFKDDKKLVRVIMTYGLWEILSEITGREFDTTKLDHVLATTGDLAKFIRNLAIAPATKDAIKAAFVQYEGIANGIDTLEKIKRLKGNEQRTPPEEMTIEWNKEEAK